MIEECFNCGISEDRVKLFDAISKEGISKICEECALKENIPIIKKPSLVKSISRKNFQEKKNQTVYERMSIMAGFKPTIKKIKTQEEIQQEKNLRKIVEENFNKEISNKEKPDFLIDNFHWSIMRARRLKHLTQKELANAITEPEIAIKMIEKGILSRGAYELIEKIEKFLGIRITRPEFIKRENSKKVKFDSINTKGMTIADLKKIEEKEDAESIWEDDVNIFSSEEELDFK